MKHSTLLLPLLAITLAACAKEEDQPTQPQNTDTNTVAQLPVAKRTYDPVRGGAQITAIYYDQGDNASVIKREDEWIEIQTDKPISTKGWILNADDPNQDYGLPDSIQSKLQIYTRTGPVTPQGEVVTLNLNQWIWNNTEPDIAWLYDENGVLVDSMTYKGH